MFSFEQRNLTPENLLVSRESFHDDLDTDTSRSDTVDLRPSSPDSRKMSDLIRVQEALHKSVEDIRKKLYWSPRSLIVDTRKRFETTESLKFSEIQGNVFPCYIILC